MTYLQQGQGVTYQRAAAAVGEGGGRETIPFLPGTQYTWDVTSPVTATDVPLVTDSALSLIRVIPNPFVVYSSYQADVTQSRVLFTNLPPCLVLTTPADPTNLARASRRAAGKFVIIRGAFQ